MLQMGRRSCRKDRSKRVRTWKSFAACHGSTSCEGTQPLQEKQRERLAEEGRTTTSGDNCGKDIGVVLDARSRLAYPFLQPSLEGEDEEESKEEEEEESVEVKVKPRLVFVSSLCAVCSEKSSVFCEECRMVRYCSTMHRKQAFSEHRELCRALAEIRFSMACTLSEESTKQLDAEGYRVYRLQLLAILESKIGRPLQLWEKEIVLYPRVCGECRRLSEKLVCCARCGMQWFCEEHASHHHTCCEQFRVFQRLLLLQRSHGYADPKIPNIYRRMPLATRATTADYGLHQFLLEFYGNSRYYREMDCYTYCMLSHLATIPLTALYSVQVSCPEWESKTEWTIHVLGAEFQFEGINLHVWEKLFLHFLPNLKMLRLVLVGPELRVPVAMPIELLSRVKVCSGCKSAGRSVTVSLKVGKLYHEVVDDPLERLAEPDLVCLFNPGLYRKTGFAGKDTWLETIRSLFCDKSTAVAVTSYTAEEMVWEMLRINSIANVEVLLQPQQNPFASVKPDRNFVSDHASPLIYKNYYVAIVRGKSLPPL